MSAPVVDATGTPCAACPWRLANQGKPHPHGFYRATNLRRLWAGLKRGERMSCHPRDPRMAEFEGYERTACSRATPECSGSLILLQREIAKFAAIAKRVEAEGVTRAGEALRRYRKTSSGALTREGLAEHVMATQFASNPLTGLHAPVVSLESAEVGYPPLGVFVAAEWREGLQSLEPRR